ncbi:MAG: FecR family protein [Prolixibacteraceae bacterium]
MDKELALKYILDTVSEFEKQKFEQWISQSSENQIKFNAFSKSWDRQTNEVNTFEVDTKLAWENVRTGIEERKNKSYVFTGKRSLQRWMAVAAVALVFILSTFVLLNRHNSSQQNNYTLYSAAQTVQSIVLPDSSLVVLNSGSELKVPEWSKKGKRSVYLKGEAFFEVSHDKSRPFLVHTSRTCTQVLGTSFNLKTSKNHDVVSLLSGKVKFYKNENTKEAVVLNPGEMASYSTKSNRIEKNSFQNKNFMAWRTGVLEFNNSAFQQVIQHIEQFYHVKVEVKAMHVDDLLLTANFDHESLSKVLSVLEMTWGVSIDIADDQQGVVIKN